MTHLDLIYSMMVYVCSVTQVDWVCHCCSCHILTSSVISCCTDSRQHEIELFHIIKKLKIVNRDVSMTLPSYKLIRKNQSECAWCNLLYKCNWLPCASSSLHLLTGRCHCSVSSFCHKYLKIYNMGIDVSNPSTLKVKVRRNREYYHMTRVSSYKTTVKAACVGLDSPYKTTVKAACVGLDRLTWAGSENKVIIIIIFMITFTMGAKRRWKFTEEGDGGSIVYAKWGEQI